MDHSSLDSDKPYEAPKTAGASVDLTALSGPWYSELTRYHWWILGVAALGWLFDTMDQRLFLLARQPAFQELLGADATPGAVTHYGGIATAVFLFGWATGGLIFGMLGDRWGRAKTMLLTIIMYAAFTGLSAFSQTWWDFMIFRFLTGLGIGGEFAAGVTLVADVMPARARPHALGLLQALSAVGNILGSMISYFVYELIPKGGWQFGVNSDGSPFIVQGWRLLFIIGILPALLAIAVRRRLKEPDNWVAAKKAASEGDETKKLGSIKDLLSDPRWLRHTIVGVTLAFSGVVGLWGVGFWTPTLNGIVVDQEFRRDIEAHNAAHPEAPRVYDALESKAKQQKVSSIAFALQDVGAFFGILVFTYVTAVMGRRFAFGLSFLLAWLVTVWVYGFMDQVWQIYWMIPMLGFFNLMVFGGFAIYFPELFPTRLRSTGTGFCYNVARYLAALGPFTLGGLTSVLETAGYQQPFRIAAIAVSSVYILGILILPFAPETKGKPLPE